MTLTLANGALLGLLGLGLVPLLIHLFARGRPPVSPFSSVEFLRKIARSTARVRRPQDWLLLALRTLAVLALVGALLRPLLFAKGRLPGGDDEKNVVLLVDRTASMAATDGARSRFSSACERAAGVLDSLRPGDRANIVWLDAAPDAAFPEPGIAHGALRDALGRAGVAEEAGNIPGAFALAAEQLDRAPGRRELWVISDFQGPAWAANAPAAPTDAELVTVQIGGDRPPNFAVTALYPEDPRPLAGEEVSILCEVANFSDQPRTSTVFLEAGEIRATEEMALPAGETGIAVFRCRFPEGGIVPIRASVEDGDFAADDSRHTAVRVSESLRVGLLAAEAETAGVFAEVLGALGWPSVVKISPADLASASEYDALFLCGWDGGEADAVHKAVASGTTVIALPADGAPAAAFRLSSGAADTLALRTDAAPTAFAAAAVDDPVFELFSGGEFGEPASGGSAQRFTIPPAAISGKTWTALATYADDIPAIARRQLPGGGAFVIWNAPLGAGGASGWTRSPGFVPFIGEVLLVSRASAPGAGFLAESEPGEPLAWRVGREILAGEAALLAPDGAVLEIAADARGGATDLRSSAPASPGLHRWTSGGALLGLGAVNFPPSESDLASAEPGDLSPGGGTISLTGAADPAALRAGIPLWPLLLIAALVLLLAEGVVSLWARRES